MNCAKLDTVKWLVAVLVAAGIGMLGTSAAWACVKVSVSCTPQIDTGDLPACATVTSPACDDLYVNNECTQDITFVDVNCEEDECGADVIVDSNSADTLKFYEDNGSFHYGRGVVGWSHGEQEGVIEFSLNREEKSEGGCGPYADHGACSMSRSPTAPSSLALFLGTITLLAWHTRRR